MDVRPGGAWRYVSSAPDRDDVAFFGEYLEIDPPKSIKWTFLFDVEGMGPQGGPETFTFEDLGDGRTRLHAMSLCDSFEGRDSWLASGMESGVNDGYAAIDRMLEAGEL